MDGGGISMDNVTRAREQVNSIPPSQVKDLFLSLLRPFDCPNESIARQDQKEV